MPSKQEIPYGSVQTLLLQSALTHGALIIEIPAAEALNLNDYSDILENIALITRVLERRKASLQGHLNPWNRMLFINGGGI